MKRLDRKVRRVAPWSGGELVLTLQPERTTVGNGEVGAHHYPATLEVRELGRPSTARAIAVGALYTILVQRDVDNRRASKRRSRRLKLT